jgi:hypothetical protein
MFFDIRPEIIEGRTVGQIVDQSCYRMHRMYRRAGTMISFLLLLPEVVEHPQWEEDTCSVAAVAAMVILVTGVWRAYPSVIRV